MRFIIQIIFVSILCANAHFILEHPFPDDDIILSMEDDAINYTAQSFDVPDLSKVEIAIYNTRGQLVEMITNSLHEPGKHTVTWDASNYSSGIYIIRMRSKQFTQFQKIMLVK